MKYRVVLNTSNRFMGSGLKVCAVTFTAFFAQPAISADLPPDRSYGLDVATPDGAKPGFYISAKVGANFLSAVSSGRAGLKFDDGYAVIGTLGYDTGDIWNLGKFRIEGELGYRKNDLDKLSVKVGALNASGKVGGDVEQMSFMANVYHDFLPGSQIRPYLGAGLGAVDSDITVSAGGYTVSGDTTEFAYQFMGGMTYEAAKNITIDAEYRYTGVDTNVNLNNHSVLIGTRFKF